MCQCQGFPETHLFPDLVINCRPIWLVAVKTGCGAQRNRSLSPALACLAADNCQSYSAAVGLTPMLEQEDSLPGTELHLPIRDRNRFACPREDHSNVGCAVVTAFARVYEIIRVLWDKSLEKFFQILARRWVGVLHNDETATSVLNKECDNAILKARLLDRLLHRIGDFVGALAVG